MWARGDESGTDGAGSQESFCLMDFALSDMIRCGRELRGLNASNSMEEAAQRVVDYLRSALVGVDGQQACALVRCFITHPVSRLPDDLARVARASLQSPDQADGIDEIPCLTLLGSSGERAEWNGRQGSRGHRAIPLESVAVVERAPMIAQLIQQMGLSVSDVLRPSEDVLLDAQQRSFNVFHVEEALGSASVPGQAFVAEHGVRSVLGFGGLLPSGDLFAVIVFSKAAISREAADLFRTIALSTKLVLLPFVRGPVFRDGLAAAAAATDAAFRERQQAEIATLQLLIPALEDAALQQTRKLQIAVVEARQRTEDLRLLNAELESRVEKRTSDLRAANEEMTTFSYSVSHDLRAPLRTIDGFVAAIEEDYAGVLDETGRGYLTRVRRGAVRMGELIDAMLQLSRVTRAELSRERVNLSTLAGEIAQELTETLPGRKVRFEIDPELWVTGDRRLLRALLQNLLSNAFKFTGRKERAEIRVGWSAADRAFFVRDNGAGFSPEQAGKLFQPFSRLHAREEFDGTGVGLATVARILRRHGGTVWGTGAVGEGATFWFRVLETDGQ